MNPVLLFGIYGSGAALAILLGLNGSSVFAEGTPSYVSSATIFYHAWCCMLFGVMLIFKTKDIWINAMGLSTVDPSSSENDRIGLQLTQICGAWVLTYALLSYFVIFFVPNAAWTLVALHVFAIFAQGSEVIIKVISNGSFGRGPVINTHHCVVQLFGLIFLIIAMS